MLVLADDYMIDDYVIRKCSLAQLREKLPELATMKNVLKLHHTRTTYGSSAIRQTCMPASDGCSRRFILSDQM